MELLAPAGNMEKLKTALHYGADAVYMAGKKFGLRTFAGNFDNDELQEAVNLAHSMGKKIYITLNIIAHNSDFEGMEEYVRYLDKIGVDAVIVSDVGIISLVREVAPNLDIHVSTQANITNYKSAQFFVNMGVKRLILAREMSVQEIKEIREKIDPSVEIECFVHGAMCISYSGRCLLSNYLCNRDSNRGACVQACRWEYYITEVSRQKEQYKIEQDERGTYILNSKDLCMIKHIKELADIGVASFKIEGRMKSPYYVANIVNAYRRAIKLVEEGKEIPDEFVEETRKSSHRQYTTGFYYGSNEKECLESSFPVQSHEFMAIVLEDSKDGKTLIEQRNRFVKGDELEILSPTDNFNKTFVVDKMINTKDEIVEDAKNVQEKLYIFTDIELKKNDILRKKVNN